MWNSQGLLKEDAARNQGKQSNFASVFKGGGGIERRGGDMDP